MSDTSFVAPPKQGMATSVSMTLGQVDPMSIRSKLMLETVSHMMTEADWPYRVATIDLISQGDEIGAFRIFGANNPNSLRDVFERKLDIAIMNPGVILSMADRGVGLFTESMKVALITVLPHYDQLAFAVSKSTGLASLSDIREKRYPLKLSVRGSLDACTTLLVNIFDFFSVHGDLRLHSACTRVAVLGHQYGASRHDACRGRKGRLRLHDPTPSGRRSGHAFR